MHTVLLVIHLLLAISLVGSILLQRSEGGALGMGGGGMGGFMTGRATSNLLSRTSAILGACFFATSLTLALMSGGGREIERSVVDRPAPSAPAVPAAPSVPAAR